MLLYATNENPEQVFKMSNPVDCFNVIVCKQADLYIGNLRTVSLSCRDFSKYFVYISADPCHLLAIYVTSGFLN